MNSYSLQLAENLAFTQLKGQSRLVLVLESDDLHEDH